MSVQVKPTNTANSANTFDGNQSGSRGVEPGTSQPHGGSDQKKRRQGESHDNSINFPKKRRYSNSRSRSSINRIKLTKGGSLQDPLNLSGLESRTVPSPAPSPDAYLERLAAPKPPPKISNLADPLNLTIDDVTGQVIGPLSPTAPVVRYKRKRLSKKRMQKLEIDFDSDNEGDADMGFPEYPTVDFTEGVRDAKLADTKSSCKAKDAASKPSAAVKVEDQDNEVSAGDVKKSEQEATQNIKPLLSLSPVKPQRASQRHRPHKQRTKGNKQPKADRKPHPKDAHFIYGNYNRYYGYRSIDKMEVDPRVKALRPSWFASKSVLDIGCNIGHVTLTIAREFGPSKAVGVDIDSSLINIARKNVKYYQQRNERKFPVACAAIYGPINPAEMISSTPLTTVSTTQSQTNPITASALFSHTPTSSSTPLNAHTSVVAEKDKQEMDTSADNSSSLVTDQPITSCAASQSSTAVSTCMTSVKMSAGGGDNSQLVKAASQKISTSTSHVGFPRNISFISGDYCLSSDAMLDMVQAEFDVILALSITKWIHLNNGDAGLKRCFKRMFLQLHPGGVLILEPQMWPSYKKKKALTEKIKKNFEGITFKPDQFNEYLLSSEVGFTTCERLNVQEHHAKGFRRPLFVFHKSTR